MSKAQSTSVPMSPTLMPSRTVASRLTGTVNYINAREAGNAEQLLAEIGYKQELKRTYSTFQVFGIAFSIMGLLPSIATILSLGLTPGPTALVWGWFIAGFFILGVGISMAELASAIPTSGGLYYWTYHYAPKKYKAFLSFIIGVTNSMCLAGGVCSITYGFAQQFLAAIYIGLDGSFSFTGPLVYAVFAGGIIGEFFITCASSKKTSHLQTVSISCNLGLIVLFMIALPVATKLKYSEHPFNDGKFIFTKYENLSTWGDGWAFLKFGLMPAVWTIGAFDSTVHMAEESKTPSKSIPVGIIGSITACWLGGFVLNILICACMPEDYKEVLEAVTGQPLIQIIYNTMGKKWAIAFSAMSAVCQFLMASSTLTAISRQVWAFSRDDGLPFSNWIKVVDKRTTVPIHAVGVSAVLALLIGLLIIAGGVAANALFSIGVIGTYVAYSTPQILRFTSGREIFRPGPFYTGKILSPIINFTTICWQLFIVVLVMFPDSKHVDSADSMNYASVLNCGVWILAILYFLIIKRKTYHGPKSNLNDEEYYDIVSSHDGEPVDIISLSKIEEKAE